MTRTVLLISSLLIGFFLATTTYASKHQQTNANQQSGKPQISSADKQKGKTKKKKISRQKYAERTAKEVIRPLRKEHAKQQERYSEAEKAYIKAQKDFNGARGTKEKADASIVLQSAQNEFFAARSGYTRSTTRYTNAKDKLSDLRKEGWRKFLENQKIRESDSGGASVALPRAGLNNAGKADTQKFRKALLRAEIRHAFATE